MRLVMVASRKRTSPFGSRSANRSAVMRSTARVLSQLLRFVAKSLAGAKRKLIPEDARSISFLMHSTRPTLECSLHPETVTEMPLALEDRIIVEVVFQA